MESMQVKIENFEGPFDLLFHLIQKNEFDIYNIPISIITKQYIDFLKNSEIKNMENISSFIVMASTLIEIKSKMLLPLEVETEKEEEPRKDLVNKILEYKKFKDISQTLKKNYDETSYNLFKDVEKNFFKIIFKKNFFF